MMVIGLILLRSRPNSGYIMIRKEKSRRKCIPEFRVFVSEEWKKETFVFFSILLPKFLP